MNAHEKEQTLLLRNLGYSISKIAIELNISANTIKSFCRRSDQKCNKTTLPLNKTKCKECGNLLFQNIGHKQKKFCSDTCRMKWWNEHRNQLERKSTTTVICPVCNKTFESYIKHKRKYCSHECYISARFKGGNTDEK